MRPVAISAAAMTPCKARYIDKTFWELAQWAVADLVKEANIPIQEVDAGVAGIYNDIFEFQAIPESGLQGIIGLANKPLMRVTNGGATGGYAMLAAHNMVASGQYDLVLLLGVEKATDCYDFDAKSPTPQVVQTIAYSWDPWYERPIGVTASSSYAQVVLAYMDEHPGDLDPLARAKVVEILSQQAQDNPYAQRYGEVVTTEQVMNSRYIVTPFKLLETCVYTEGAVDLLLASEEVAREIEQASGKPPVWITGIAAANEPYFVGKTNKYKQLHRIYSDHLASHDAYEQAGVTPKDIKVVELHDACVPQLMMTMAEMGFVPLGKANDTLQVMRPAGDVWVNKSGGLTFGGHFVGGSNGMSAKFAMDQMLAQQLPHGLVHGTGASIAMYGFASVLSLEKRSPKLNPGGVANG